MVNNYLSCGTTTAVVMYPLVSESLESNVYVEHNLSCIVADEIAGQHIFKPMPAILKAVDAYASMDHQDSKNGFVVRKDGKVVTQYYNESSSDYTVCCIGANTFTAIVIDEYYGKKPFVLKQSKRDSSEKTLPDGVFFGLLCYLLHSTDSGVPLEMQMKYQLEMENVDSSEGETEASWMFVLANELKVLMQNPDKYVSAGFFDSHIFVPNPNEMDWKENEVTETTKGCINMILVKGVNVDDSSSFDTLTQLREKYTMNRELSEEDRRLIPDLPETYVIPDKMVYALELISKSDRFRNFILRGPAGTGKTEWVKILASSLELPYLFFGCSTDTEKMDLTMSIIPGDSSNGAVTVSEIDPAEWVLDPVMSYAEITGKVKPDATEKDCLEAVLAKATASKEDGSFKYVESSLIKAFRNGFVVEVQEPTIMSRPGVLASLNSMFDGCKAVTLVNGETVHRHKDAIIVYTTNTSYEGCVGLNQSALSRMVAIDLDELSDEKMVERLSKNTGYTNEAVLNKMVAVFRLCQEKAAQEAIMDGSIDMRAMEDWALANAITGAGTIYQNGVNMLISKTSNDPTLREEFMSCLESQFKRTD